MGRSIRGNGELCEVGREATAVVRRQRTAHGPAECPAPTRELRVGSGGGTSRYTRMIPTSMIIMPTRQMPMPTDRIACPVSLDYRRGDEAGDDDSRARANDPEPRRPAFRVSCYRPGGGADVPGD